MIHSSKAVTLLQLLTYFLLLPSALKISSDASTTGFLIVKEGCGISNASNLIDITHFVPKCSYSRQEVHVIYTYFSRSFDFFNNNILIPTLWSTSPLGCLIARLLCIKSFLQNFFSWLLIPFLRTFL